MQAAYAQARGFFARQGIDAELKAFADPSLIPAAVLSGDVQFSSFNVGGIANLKSRGAPVKLVAAGALYRPRRADDGDRRRAGEEDHEARTWSARRSGSTPQTIAHVGLLKWLKRSGVSESDVTLVEFSGFAPILGPLRRGQIDAAVLPEPYLTQAMQRGSRRVAPLFDATCPTDCLITGWMARKDIDPGLAARFRNAIQAAAVWAEPEEEPGSQRRHPREAGVDRRRLVRRMTRTSFATRLRPGAGTALDRRLRRVRDHPGVVSGDRPLEVKESLR